MEILEENLTLAPKKNRNNPRKDKKLKSFQLQNTLNQNIINLGCFNFSYFRKIDNSQSFEDWQNEEILADLMDKIKEFSKKSLQESKNEKRLKLYGDFPTPDISDYVLPQDLPENGLKWGSFRITGEKRLIGFIVSDLVEGLDCSNLKNTFFVVFLDKNHKFYKSKKKHT
jgi:quinol monooxygenase YgiN